MVCRNLQSFTIICPCPQHSQATDDIASQAQLESEVGIYLCMVSVQEKHFTNSCVQVAFADWQWKHSQDHPHITRLFDVYEADDQLYLVMECMEAKKQSSPQKLNLLRSAFYRHFSLTTHNQTQTTPEKARYSKTEATWSNSAVQRSFENISLEYGRVESSLIVWLTSNALQS